MLLKSIIWLSQYEKNVSHTWYMNPLRYVVHHIFSSLLDFNQSLTKVLRRAFFLRLFDLAFYESVICMPVFFEEAG